jgi:hypothetical protein
MWQEKGEVAFHRGIILTTFNTGRQDANHDLSDPMFYSCGCWIFQRAASGINPAIAGGRQVICPHVEAAIDITTGGRVAPTTTNLVEWNNNLQSCLPLEPLEDRDYVLSSHKSRRGVGRVFHYLCTLQVRALNTRHLHCPPPAPFHP